MGINTNCWASELLLSLSWPISSEYESCCSGDDVSWCLWSYAAVYSACGLIISESQSAGVSYAQSEQKYEPWLTEKISFWMTNSLTHSEQSRDCLIFSSITDLTSEQNLNWIELDNDTYFAISSLNQHWTDLSWIMALLSSVIWYFPVYHCEAALKHCIKHYINKCD